MSNRLPHWIVLAAVFSLVQLSAFAGEWIPLFDGKTTNGWTPRAKVERFEAKNGELHLISKVNVWVTTDLKFSDFELEAEVKLPAGADEHYNSGVAFRCVGETGKPKGYQFEIDARRPSQTGGVYGIGFGGWLYPNKLTQKEFFSRTKDVFKFDAWNRLRIVCQGPRIQTFLNGQPVADMKDSQSLKGYFGIQHHGRGEVVRFRNLRVRDLGGSEAKSNCK